MTLDEDANEATLVGEASVEADFREACGRIEEEGLDAWLSDVAAERFRAFAQNLAISKDQHISNSGSPSVAEGEPR